MQSKHAAEEHLRVIRSLMEKATVYRAISAQAALAAGAIGCVVGFTSVAFRVSKSEQVFVLKWVVVLLVSIAANLYFLRQDATRRGEPFISAGMKMALRAMWPPLLCGGAATIIFGVRWLVPFWMIFYALAVLSTTHFAPRSLERLGFGFLIGGLLTLLSNASFAGPFAWSPDLLMGLTFGVLHVVYAAFTWPRRQPAGQPAQ